MSGTANSLKGTRHAEAHPALLVARSCRLRPCLWCRPPRSLGLRPRSHSRAFPSSGPVGASGASEEPGAGPRLTEGSIECAFYYRVTNEADSDTPPEDLQFSERVLQIGPNEEKTATLGLLQLHGTYSLSEFDADTFSLRVTAGETRLLSTLYQLSGGLPVNQFVGDHGFTGLMYFTHPTEGGDYQAICKSVEA